LVTNQLNQLNDLIGQEKESQMAKKAKVITGAKAQETTVQDVKVTAVEKQRKDLGFVDYRKSRDTIIEGKFILNGILVGDDKKRHWMFNSVNPDGTKGKIVAYLGDRKDGKGVYCRSEILQICSELDKVESTEKEVIKA
jgi:hypothetical protein